MAELLAVRGIENTSPAFRRELIRMAERLGADPDFLTAVMSFETGGTFSPSKKNPVSSATGLIQFMGKTARNLGTTTADLAAMTDVEQLAYVEKYLRPAAGRLNTISDHYMAVFAPVGIGKSSSFVLYSDPKTVAANEGLDRHPKDGKITVGEAVLHVASIHEAAKSRPRIFVDMDVSAPALEAPALVPVAAAATLVSLTPVPGRRTLRRLLVVALVAVSAYAVALVAMPRRGNNNRRQNAA